MVLYYYEFVSPHCQWRWCIYVNPMYILGLGGFCKIVGKVAHVLLLLCFFFYFDQITIMMSAMVLDSVIDKEALC